MIAPRKTKYRTTFVRSNDGVASKGFTIEYGDIALLTLENAFLTPNQIESARRVISAATKRVGKLWIRIFPDQPMTSKPANVRMGSGKGPLKNYVATVQAGKILFELGGLPLDIARTALFKASKKLPIKVKIIEKN